MAKNNENGQLPHFTDHERQLVEDLLALARTHASQSKSPNIDTLRGQNNANTKNILTHAEDSERSEELKKIDLSLAELAKMGG